jgi:hypothetical protein
VVLSSSTEQTVTDPGGNPKLGLEFDPIAQDTSPDACKTVSAEEPAGTASYSQPVTGTGFTLMGLPTVVTDIEATGTANGDGQLDGRLWDVLPGGEERLISRGGYRLDEPQTPQIVFQLHGNGYKFEVGDKVKLELTSSDAPYYRASNGAFTIKIKSATIVLPTLDEPNGGQIQPPESVSLPLPESVLSPTSSPIGILSNPSATPAAATGKIEIKASRTSKAPCVSKRAFIIHLPRYRNSRVTELVVLVDGKRTRTVHGHSLRSVLVSLEGRPAGPVTVRLRARVRRGGRLETRTITHRYRLCVARLAG